MSGLAASFRARRGEAFEVAVDLTIDTGETVALLGPNGAGKSTVVDALAGHLPIEEGSIALGERVLDDGRVTFVAPDARNIGVVFQNYLLFDHLDVVDNIAFGLAVEAPRREARERARAWLEPMGLVELAKRKPPELSGGQAQRVAVARALAPAPDLVLLDEPLAALDARTRHQVRRTLAQHLSAYAGPRLLITHEPMDAFLLADRIVVMEDGVIVQRGTPDDIRRAPATEYVAALSGTNLLTGRADSGQLTVPEGPRLATSDVSANGDVLIVIDPAAVALYPDEPHGSPRNTWLAEVESVERLGDIVRVRLGGPLKLMCDITPAAATALGVTPGQSLWATVKATEVSVSPA